MPPHIFYVSTKGSNSNSGLSPESAFATLNRARQAVRTVNRNMTGNILVRILPGTYRLRRTFLLTTHDSGTGGHRVEYVAAGGPGTVRISGGMRVGDWRRYRGKVMETKIGSGRHVSTMYENGLRADMARWPKRTSPFATSRAGYMTYYKTPNGKTFVIEDNSVGPGNAPFDPAGKTFSHAWFYAFCGADGHRWTSATVPITHILGNHVYVSGSFGIGWPPDSCFVENSLALLSRPGEYYYSESSGRLYYRSRFAGAPARQKITVPLLNRLVGVVGKPGRPAHSISFIGLTFSSTDRVLPIGAGDWSFESPASRQAAVYVKNADGITLRDCQIVDSGDNGVTFAVGTMNCGIVDSLIWHTGTCGVLLQGSHNRVRNCLIRYAGELQGQGDGVEIAGKGHNTLRHLDIYYCARAGISLGASDNTIEYVRVRQCVQDTADQGAIYLVDPARNNTFNQCISSRNYCDLTNMDRPPTAIYNDRDAVGTHWSNIVAKDSQFYLFRHDPMQKPGKPITFANVNWKMKYRPKANQATTALNPDFNPGLMKYSAIGIVHGFPAAYNNLRSQPAVALNLWAQPGNGQVRLAWTESDRAVRYIILRAGHPAGPFRQVGISQVPKTGWYLGTAYTDRHVLNGATYYYRVVAVNAAGASPPDAAIRAVPDSWKSNRLHGWIIGTVAQRRAAFDGNLRTCTGNKGWVGLDLGSPKVITEIDYTPRADSTDTTAWMCGGEFQGANNPDFAHPVTLFKIWGTKGGAGTPVRIPVGIYDKTAFRYVRYFNPRNATVAELRFYGHAPRVR